MGRARLLHVEPARHPLKRLVAEGTLRLGGLVALNWLLKQTRRGGRKPPPSAGYDPPRDRSGQCRRRRYPFGRMKLRVYFKPEIPVLLLGGAAAALWCAFIALEPGWRLISLPFALFYSALFAIGLWCLWRIARLERPMRWDQAQRLLEAVDYPDPCRMISRARGESRPATATVSPGWISGDNVLTDRDHRAWLTDFGEAGLAATLWNVATLEAALRFDWGDHEESAESARARRAACRRGVRPNRARRRGRAVAQTAARRPSHSPSRRSRRGPGRG